MAYRRLVAFLGWRIRLGIGQPEIVNWYLLGAESSRWWPHSIYFTLMGEHGFLGLGLFLTLVASCLWTLRSLRRGRTRPSWVRSYSHMLEVSLVGYLVNGAFLSVAYVDLFYTSSRA